MAARLGILAGGGDLPARLAQAARASGREPVLVAFEGHTEPATVEGVPHLWSRFGAAATILDFLRAQGVAELVFAGPVRRPSFSEIRPDWRAAKFLAKVGARALGDDGFLRAIARGLEEEGFRVVGIQDILRDLLAPAGNLGAVVPDAAAELDIARGVEVARALGALDVGQAAVVQQGLVLGVEGIEGTDALIARCGGLRRDGPGGVLVKVKKPQQDRRLDLPTIGVRTVEGAAAAGLRGIAIEAGGALLMDRAATIAAADGAGLFLVGIEPKVPVAASKELVLFLVAGEPSGDLLGARLMAALKARADRPLRFVGVGGPRMVAEGLETLFPMADLAVMGVVAAAARLPLLIDRINRTVAAIRDIHPQAIITIDAPGFCFRVGRRLRRGRHPVRDVPLIHYVAPSVWAWRPKRAKKVAQFLDHLMALFPCEPPWFLREGLGCTFVGHPIIESGADQGDAAAFRARHGLAPSARLLVVLPGSRTSELRWLLPDFRAALALLAPARPDLVAVVPTVPHLAAQVRSAVADWPLPVVVVEGDQDKYGAFAAAEAALAASGTVALELALARLPGVVAYRLNWLAGEVYRALIKTKYVNLVNIMHEREVVPELIQDKCRPDRLAAAVARLLDDPEARQAQVDGLIEVDRWLGAGGEAPSVRAAAVVWRLATGADRQEKEQG